MHQQGMAPAWGMEPQIEPGMSLDREQDDDDAPIDSNYLGDFLPYNSY